MTVIRMVASTLFSRDVVLMLIGATVGWGISYYFYERSLSDMKKDALGRKRIEDLMLRGIESVGTIKYQRDSLGNIVGVTIELKGAAVSQANATGTLQTGETRK